MSVQPDQKQRPAIAIVGRPNVGKSTLFNRLTRRRDALVADVPGLTRDPRIGIGRIGEAAYIAIDTGGIDEGSEHDLDASVAAQAMGVARGCTCALLLVDARAGANAADDMLYRELRRNGVQTYLVINKAEGLDPSLLGAEFSDFGGATMFSISASHGDGGSEMVETITSGWPDEACYEGSEEPGRLRMAVVGRPNVGKSTLVNRLLGEERMITFDQPGTTRDSIDSHFERRGKAYTIIDTAGLRRKSKTRGIAEKFSAVQTLQSIDRAQVVLLLIDARDGVTEQDVSLIGLALNSGRALLVVVNKWDGLDTAEKAAVKRALDRRLRFAEFADVYYISALHGTGVGHLFKGVDHAFKSATEEHKTSDLSRILDQAVSSHPPPLVRGRRIKLRYAHLGGRNPPTIIIHGNQVDEVPGSYVRYLENYFRNALNLVGTPIRIEFRQGDNPYAGRRNQLNKRQQAKRRRLMRHVKR